MEPNQSSQFRDAEDLRNLRAANLALVRVNLRHSSEIDGRIFNMGAVELEIARIRSQWEDAQKPLNSWSRAECPTGVGSGDTT